VRTPAVLLAIPLTIGSATGLLVGERANESLALWAAAAAVLALISAVGALAADDDAAVFTCCAVACALAVGLSSGASTALSAYRSPLYLWFLTSKPAGAPIFVQGVLREDASLGASGVSLAIDVRLVEPCSSADDNERSACPTRGGVRLSVAGDLALPLMGQWRAGRTVRVPATLREPTVYRDPGVPDEQRALARRGIALVGSVKSAALVELIARGSLMSERAAAFRAWVRDVLAATVAPWSQRSAGVAAAIAIGDRTGLAPADEERLQAAGTYHVIAISGGNIAILTVMLLVLGRWLGVPARGVAVATIGLLLAYGQVTGPAPSVDRAISAAVLFLVARLLEHRTPPLNVLAVAAALALTVSPATVFDPGFILSFGATLGILVGVPRLPGGSAARGDSARSLIGILREFAGAAVAMLRATVAAEIALAPIAAAMFGRVTIAGLLLNFAAIPLMTIVQVGSFAGLGVWLVDRGLARWCGYVVHLSGRGLIDSARLVELVPWLWREVPPPAWECVAAYYAALILALVRRPLSRVAGVTAALLAALIVAGPHATARDAVPIPKPGTLRVVFLDVGQGDATLLLLPDRRAFLVDAGGLPAAPLQDATDGPAFDIGERVVAPALRAFGVRAIDTLVLTHADSDHIGGALALLTRFRPRAVWEGVPVPRNEPLQWVHDGANAIAAEWRVVQAGDELHVRDVSLRVLHPPLPEWERQRVRNDDSVVLEARFGNVSIILPGDVGKEGETQLLDRIDSSRLTILKVPHHGSATSSTSAFVDKVRPLAVIFSAGRNNRFGHPAKAVMDRYRAAGAEIFSTADDGAVVLDTDGKSVELRTWTGRLLRLERRTREAMSTR
jgi:competence protein ComEC